MRLDIQLDPTRINEFVASHPYAHHMKTSFWGELQRSPNCKPHYFGFYQQDQLVATAVVLEHRVLGGQYWYIPFGPCVDYQNEKLLSDVLHTIRNECKRQNILFVRIDPNQERQEHNKAGDVVEGGYSHETITKVIEHCGFHHLGYNYGYSGNWQPRFTYVLAMDAPVEQLIAGSDKENQTYLKKNIRRGLRVRIGTQDELDCLEQFGVDLAKKLNFEPKTKDDYAAVMHHYPDHHLYLVAEASLTDAIENLQADIDGLSSQIQQLQSKVRNQGRIKEMTREMNNIQEELAEIQAWQQAEGDVVVLGAGLFVYIGVHSYDLYLYSNKSLKNFRAPISIHYQAMELLQARGVRYYDFVGISGSLDRNDPFFGLYDFKRRFGGDFKEYLGEFDCVNHPMRYQIYQTLHKTKRRVERKLLRMRNKYDK